MEWKTWLMVVNADSREGISLIPITAELEAGESSNSHQIETPQIEEDG